MRAPDTLPPEVERDLDAMDAAVAGLPREGGDAVLAELAALLAGDRPQPDPEWARALDARAAQGFAKPRRRLAMGLRRLPGGWMGPAVGLAACGLIALVVGLTTLGSDPRTGGDAGVSAGAESAGGGASSSAASQGAPAPAKHAPTRQAAPPSAASDSTP